MKCLVCNKHPAKPYGIICNHCAAVYARIYGAIVRDKVLQAIANTAKPETYLIGTGEATCMVQDRRPKNRGV